LLNYALPTKQGKNTLEDSDIPNDI
jgi:hypothetical protein